MSPLVNIVILNWNGAEDTLECLDSLRALRAVRFRVTVCDNDSSDNSLAEISRWANSNEVTHEVCQSGMKAGSDVSDLTLIANGENLGFAGGNNTGVAYALSQPDVDYVWLLNNDTVVEPDALEKLVRRCEGDKEIGICGSLLKFYDDRSAIQAVGGCRFNEVTGIASQTLGRYLPDSTVLDRTEYEAQMDYVCRASMLVSRAFLEEVGLMEERYFLYYEEIDWAVRAKGKFRLGIAIDSIVYHKEGSSIGSASLHQAASPTSEFYMARSKMRFMAAHFSAFLPLSGVLACLQAMNRFRRGQWQSGTAILRATFGLPLTMKAAA